MFSPRIPACFGWNSSLVWQFGEILLGWAADHWLLITVDIQVFNHVWLSAAPISFLEFISRDIHQLFSFIPGMMIPLQVMKANTYSPEKVHSVSDQKLLHRPCLKRSLSVSFGIKLGSFFWLSILYISGELRTWSLEMSHMSPAFFSACLTRSITASRKARMLYNSYNHWARPAHMAETVAVLRAPGPTPSAST